MRQTFTKIYPKKQSGKLSSELDGKETIIYFYSTFLIFRPGPVILWDLVVKWRNENVALFFVGHSARKCTLYRVKKTDLLR